MKAGEIGLRSRSFAALDRHEVGPTRLSLWGVQPARSSVAIAAVPAPAAVQTAEPTIRFSRVEVRNANTEADAVLTNSPTVKVTLEVSPQDAGGHISFFGGTNGLVSVLMSPTVVPAGKSVSEMLDLAQFANQGAQSLIAEWRLKAGRLARSDAYKIKIDTIGPTATSVRLVGGLGGDSTLELQFDEDDVHEASAKNAAHFRITRTGGAASFASESGFKRGTPSLSADHRTLLIPLTDLVTDNYQLEILDTLTDRAGNAAGHVDGKLVKEQRFLFSSYPDRERGEHVEFPEFVRRPRPAPGEFNPGDHVETRVARLYYYRDAHRVAEIINRNVKSYNRAAVDQKRREAGASRERADTATDERRTKEREAVQAAQETRQAERRVQLAEQAVDQAAAAHERDVEMFEAVSAQLKRAEDLTGDIRKKLSDAPAEDKDRMQAELREAEAEVKRMRALQTSASDAQLASAATLRERQKELANERAALEAHKHQESTKREEWLRSEAKEDRAHEDQFRKEVAAAHEDPDTYAPGRIESVDPVTQVSISVIGEGLIQLRGPIRGINKIRTMIHQIDTPVGQVKVGIFTVQVNGDRGERMERVAQRIEGHIDLSRFLTSQSMMLLRRAVQEVASEVARETEYGGHYQLDRDRKYLYAFFGRDFVDELYAMDSEFLRSGNKLLALHSMDTVSRSSALFIMALAKNDVRQRILNRFIELVRCEMPQAEYDFRKASKVMPCDMNSLREIRRHVCEIYRFRSLRGMYDVPLDDDLMTPMQREFIRMAQIFKSQMVAEVELKQRVIERALIEDRANEEQERFESLFPLRRKAITNLRESHTRLLDSGSKVEAALAQLQQVIDAMSIARETGKRLNETAVLAGTLSKKQAPPKEQPEVPQDVADALAQALAQALDSKNDGKSLRIDLGRGRWFIGTGGEKNARTWTLVIPGLAKDIQQWREALARIDAAGFTPAENLQNLTEAVTICRELGNLPDTARDVIQHIHFAKYEELGRRITGYMDGDQRVVGIAEAAKPTSDRLERVRRAAAALKRAVESAEPDWIGVEAAYQELLGLLPDIQGDMREHLRRAADDAYHVANTMASARANIRRSEADLKAFRQKLDHRKLLDHLIDEHEDKYIELLEGTRAHIAAVDNHLKRLAIALEDDFKVQFYDPAFAEVRKAAWEWDVNLGQVERTTILTNNRAFAKVTPQATLEFDLPKRDILIQEAMKGAKAMVEDFGGLLQDPTFLAATQLMSGSPTASVASPPRDNVAGLPNQGQAAPPVKSVLPALPSSTEEEVLNQSGGPPRELGAKLEALIPDPAIYKFETGTGFEIRPVIQPDGDSIIYHFNYMYTTNVREPVRADEKHLGRVKRHFIDTEVQTSSFELREISRYQVALKASRTSRGVPLFEDIPVAGVLFRPLPSAESALQQNIILGQSTIYPTLFDLMGLRWAPHVVDTTDASLRGVEHVIRGRRQAISDFVFEEASRRVDEFLEIDEQGKYRHLHRPDLYHRQVRPSPHHPEGYSRPRVDDPTDRGFMVPDGRPAEFRDPPYDSLRRTPLGDDASESVWPGAAVEPIDSGRPAPSAFRNSDGELRPAGAETPSRGNVRQAVPNRRDESRVARPETTRPTAAPAPAQQPSLVRKLLGGRSKTPPGVDAQRK
jgi:hypothetical protein